MKFEELCSRNPTDISMRCAPNPKTKKATINNRIVKVRSWPVYWWLLTWGAQPARFFSQKTVYLGGESGVYVDFWYLVTFRLFFSWYLALWYTSMLCLLLFSTFWLVGWLVGVFVHWLRLLSCAVIADGMWLVKWLIGSMGGGGWMDWSERRSTDLSLVVDRLIDCLVDWLL